MRICSGLLPGQVLQRVRGRARATLLGDCEAIGPVTATLRAADGALPGWRGRRIGRAAHGVFRADLAGLKTGGPYQLELACGAEQVVLKDIFVGDVWLLAGQSNMEGIGRLATAPRPHPLVRARAMDGRWVLARDPLHVLDESPDAVHNPGRVTAAEAKRARRARLRGAGVGVPFGAAMVARSGVPQGLICTAHGGTSMAQWDPALRTRGGDSLYGSLLASWRATGQPVAGVLWYQGESDAYEAPAAAYSAAMRRFVSELRRDLRQPRLAFLMVQLGRNPSPADPRWWNAIQDQQRRLPESVRHLGVVGAADLSLDDGVHISTEGFQRLGGRLARLATTLALGDRREALPPTLLSVRRVEPSGDPSAPPSRFAVRFANVVGGLRAAGEPTGFSLIDRAGRPLAPIHRVRLHGDTVLLDSEQLSDGSLPYVQYGHGRDPYLNITDARDLPLPVFSPLPIANAVAMTAFAETWRTSAIRTGEAIARLPRPEPRAFGRLHLHAQPGPLVNFHADWDGHSGHVACFAELRSPITMTVDLRFGYDGPIRAWLGGKEVLRDLHGTNPALPDARIARVRVGKGRTRIAVLMALNQGRAWGFFLRASLPDASQADIIAERVALPTFTAS